MTLINPDLSGIADGAVGDAADWVTPMNTIIDVINGGLTTANFTAAGTDLGTIAAATAWTDWISTLYKSDGTTGLAGARRIARYIKIGKTVTGVVNFTGIDDPAGAIIYFDLPVTAKGEATSTYFTMIGAAWTNNDGTVGTGQCLLKLGATASLAGILLPANGTWGTAGASKSFYCQFTYEAS